MFPPVLAAIALAPVGVDLICTILPSDDFPAIILWASVCNWFGDAEAGWEIFKIWLAPWPDAGDTIIIDWLCWDVCVTFGFI